MFYDFLNKRDAHSINALFQYIRMHKSVPRVGGDFNLVNAEFSKNLKDSQILGQVEELGVFKLKMLSHNGKITDEDVS